MKAVMYHYIRSTNNKYPYFRFLHIDNFKKQLDWFSNNGGFVDKEDFIRVMKGETIKYNKSGFVLTFDDGLYEHHNIVLPELEKRGLWGIFYIPTLPYIEKKILDVHKIHLLLGSHGGKKMLDAIKKVISPNMLIHRDKNLFIDNTYSLQSDFNDEVEFKRILNYQLLYEHREHVLDELLRLYIDLDVNINDIYMSESMISDLHNSGMIIGGHSNTHRLMSRLSVKEQELEISTSFNIIDQIVGGLKIKTFCYPYGGSYSYNEETLKALKKNNVLFSFSVDSKDIAESDINSRLQELPRYDTIEFPC
ncbi:polysaccharide deacetylase family protein [Candidatus Woesearchaeota archaeon]|jgi:peptidoglycan/xylan/chitin deacetylase (PgdA/CDA1 family)|nr:polysaccharide deacetylase family protein [Candidatus Woesearchaeota archaeon]